MMTREEFEFKVSDLGFDGAVQDYMTKEFASEENVLYPYMAYIEARQDLVSAMLREGFDIEDYT